MQEIFIQEGEAIIRAHILARIQNKVQIQIIDIL